MAVIYRKFDGPLPSSGSLARPIKAGQPNIECMIVDDPAAYRSKGWSESIESAEGSKAKAVEAPPVEEAPASDDSSEGN